MKNKKEDNLDKETNLELKEDSKSIENKVIVNDNGTKEVVETSLVPNNEKTILSKEERGLLRAKKARKIRSYIMTFFGLVVSIIFIYAFLFME